MGRSSRAELPHDVAIAGYGPVGAVMASLLARAGHRAVVIEARQEVFPQPRAIAFDGDTMRIFQSIGLADRLIGQLGRYLPTEYRGMDGRAIAHFISRPKTDLESWDSNYIFNSPQMEAELRRTVDELDDHGPDVLLSHRLVDFREEEDRCVLDVQAVDGSRKTLRASYLLGCDGANSTVRRLAGIELESYEFDRPFIVIDAVVNPDLSTQLPSINVQYCDPERPASYIVGPSGMRRWEIMLLPGEDPAVESSPEGLKRHLGRWLPSSGYEILRAAAYTFHGLIAKQWRKSRAMLLGDAVHQTPPFMGQGLCQGIRDASNLAWKLDLVLKGRGGESLLDTYQREREPHVQATTRQAIRLGHVVCETGKALAAARDKRMREENGVPPRTVIRQSLIPPLSDGILSSAGGALRGTLVPQPDVVAGMRAIRLDDVAAGIRIVEVEPDHEQLDGKARALLTSLGTKIVLLQERDTPAAEDELDVLEVTSAAMRTYLHENGARGILIRPDNYIFGSFGSQAGLIALVAEYLRMIGAAAPVGSCAES